MVVWSLGADPLMGVLPYMSYIYIYMCGPKGYGFSVVLVINRVWILHSNDSFPTSPKKMEQHYEFNFTKWRHIFKVAKQICRETKLKEFQHKFLHRIIVTKKELCCFGIKQDSDCLYCGKEDSIEHTFINCQFSKAFQRRVIQWFNIE